MTASARQPALKLAFGSVPKDGGTFTFYRNQRPALLAHGIDLRCVTLGVAEAALVDPAYIDEGCVVLAPRAVRLRTQARAFVDWCVQEGVDAVMGINSPGILSAIPHLPPHIRALSRCANGFDHGYRITLSGGARLSRIVALTPRLRDTLVSDYGVAPERIELIPNGIEPAPFDAAARQPRGQGARLELGFLGRLEHGQKGVMHLPPIVEALVARGVEFRLRIAGKGRDEPALRAALADHIAAGRVELLGALTPGAIPGFLGSLDLFVFTSHFEGCPNALLEAMMAGAAPVSWTISGITDYLIAHGETGWLCPLGDAAAMADIVARLDADRAALQQTSVATAERARERFTPARAAAAYAAVLQEPMPAEGWGAPAPWSSFRPDANFPHEWRRGLKAAIRRAARPGVGASG